MALVFVGFDRVDPGLFFDHKLEGGRMYVGLAFSNLKKGPIDWHPKVLSSNGKDLKLYDIVESEKTWVLQELDGERGITSAVKPPKARVDRKSHPLNLQGLFGMEARLSEDGLRAIRRGQESPPDLAQRIKSIIDKYVKLPEEDWQYDLIATWIAGTYLYKLFSIYPFLLLTSVSPGSGKSRLLQVIERLAFNAEHPYGISESALIRFSAASACTLLVDEQEMLGRQANLGRKIIELFNARYESTGNYMMSAPQADKKWKPESFKLFGPTAIAKLSEGGIPPAIESRSIKILMEQLPKDGSVEERRRQLRHLHQDSEWGELRDALYLWAIRNWKSVYQTYLNEEGDTVVGVNRQLDLWRVLLSVSKHLDGSTHETLCHRAQNASERTESATTRTIRRQIDQLRDNGEETIRVKDFARRLGDELPAHLRNGGQPLSRVLRGLKDELEIEVRPGSGNVNYIYL